MCIQMNKEYSSAFINVQTIKLVSDRRTDRLTKKHGYTQGGLKPCTPCYRGKGTGKNIKVYWYQAKDLENCQ